MQAKTEDAIKGINLLKIRDFMVNHGGGGYYRTLELAGVNCSSRQQCREPAGAAHVSKSIA